MLYNLVSNALDHGPGLTPEEWQAALQPFQRIRATPGDGHTGLGLALVQRVVQAYRGSLNSRRTPDGFLIDAPVRL